MFDLDWQEILVPSASIAEVMVRGTMVYLTLFFVMRFLPRRTMGAMGPSDLLIIVLLADAVQQAMAGKYESVTEGLVLAATLIFWAFAIDWLDYRFPMLHLSDGKQIPLIRNGKFIYKNMNRQMITEDEVMAQLRQHGLDSARSVQSAYLEGDGHFSVLLRGGAPVQSPPERRIS
jgi:uncharacterized membrane protein YcaP (DUF421 family)